MKSIYDPAEDSELLVECVRRVVKGGKALDMGTGSGVIVEELLKHADSVVGVDVNPIAVNYCSKRFPKAKFIQSNLFSNVRGKFDVITFNPPYLPEDEREGLEAALTNSGGALGYELLLKFLKQAREHLTINGFVLTVFSTLTKPDVVLKEAEKLGYSHEIIGERKVFFEKLFCVKFWLKKN